MAFDENALNLLLARMTTQHTVRGFVFNAMVEHVAEKKGDVIASGLQERILKKRPSDLLSYPASDFFKLLHGGAVALEDPAGQDEAVRALGFASAAGFFASPMGRLLLTIVGRGNPARLMANEPTAYATSFSFGKRKFKRVGEQSIQLTHAEDFLPVPYNLGALQGAMAAVGATAQQVLATHLVPDGATYEITW